MTKILQINVLVTNEHFKTTEATINRLIKNEAKPSTYFYEDLEGLNTQVGDVLLLKAPIDNTFAFGTVTEIFEDEMKNMEKVNKAHTGVFAKLDLTVYKEKIEKVERAKYVKQKIDKMKSEMEEMAMLKLMAQDDPEAAKLVEEYKALKPLLLK